MRAGLVLLCLLLLCLLGALASPLRAQTLSDPSLQLEIWASGLTHPTQLAFLADGEALVVEHTAGRVRYVVDGVLQSPAAFVLGSGGTGVLGIAIHQANPPEVFLYIEDMTEIVGNRVNSYTWNAALGVLENQQLVHQFPPGAPGSQHDAGVMVIGPESEPGAGAPYLYVAAGDRQGNGQLQNNPAGAPPDDSGVILRIRRDGTPAPGNPFTPYCSATTTTTCNDENDCPGAETCVVRVAKYYAYGIRNHFGLVFDPITRQLWDTENGDLTWDEVNRVEPGMNSGWMKLQGPGDPNTVTLFNIPGAGSTYSDPEFAWFVPTGPTGIAFPVNSTLGPDYQRSLLFGDFNQPGRIYALPLNLARTALDTAALPANLDDATADTRAELDSLVFGTGFTGSVLDLEMGPDGALYVATYFDGRIYRISGPHPVPVPSLPVSGLAGLAVALLAIAAFGMNRSDSAPKSLAKETRSANDVIPATVALKRHLTCASG